MSTIVRDDLSDSLIHLTKGSPEEAFANLVKILNDQALLGGTGHIKGKRRCVCFSEAPISKLPQILATPHKSFRYRPYGLLFKKAWVFARGGRPAIYQPAADYDLLPDIKKYLHVTFNLGAGTKVDFTWEREWRILASRVEFSPADVTIVVPSRRISDALKEDWTGTLSENVKKDPKISITSYPWHCVVLGDLGIDVPDDLG